MLPKSETLGALVSPVRHLHDLREGESVRLSTAPPIAVLRTEGALYAIDDTCTHQDASPRRRPARAARGDGVGRPAPPHFPGERGGRLAGPRARRSVATRRARDRAPGSPAA
ncbi:hypothetical protein GCM10009730_57620 [Streptomyces albidochromogenes]